jgi:septation ring formation regulator EzrA
VNEPIQTINRQLWQHLVAIAKLPGVPTVLVDELFQIHLRLAAHLNELRHKKAKLEAAHAELELI